MLCFVQTDAAIDAVTLDRLLRAAVERSFERISVDGQLSTNDSVFCIASGAAGIAVEPGADDERAFGAALDALLRQLALEIVADGEGAERVARLVVRGSVEAVDPVARAVANSPLVKCALHGGDPNWGRILAAAGQAVPDADPGALDLYIEDVQVASARQRRRARRRPAQAPRRGDVAHRRSSCGWTCRRAGRRRRSSSATSGTDTCRSTRSTRRERRRRDPSAAAGASRCCWSRSPTSGSSSAARS